MLPKIQHRGDLELAACHSDFTWGRPHERVKRRIPNRETRSVEFGHEDFADLCRHLKAPPLNLPIHSVIRGHDHIPQRFAQFDKYQPVRMVTINTLCRRLEREYIPGVELTTPAVASWDPRDDRILIHRLQIDEALARSWLDHVLEIAPADAVTLIESEPSPSESPPNPPPSFNERAPSFNDPPPHVFDTPNIRPVVPPPKPSEAVAVDLAMESGITWIEESKRNL
jgi:hypothetical protein